MEQLEQRIILHVSLPKKKEQTCPSGEKKKRVHDYLIQKVNYLKWFERISTILVIAIDEYKADTDSATDEKRQFITTYVNMEFKWKLW